MTGASPPVTVLMCVFNDERYVAQAVESILGQDFGDFELVIIDDGSTDRTPQILRSLAERDARIRVHRQANAGTTAAANAGLALAKGSLVARLDSDDCSFPYRLREQVDFFSRHPDVGLLGGGSEIIDPAGRVLGVRNIETRDPRRVLHHRCIYQQSDVMFRREIVARLGGYREKFRNAQDYDLWLRISEVAEIAKSSRLYGQWRLNGGGYTLSRMQEQKREVAIIKAMAARRRAGLPDGYDAYQPAPAPPHRSAISQRDFHIFSAGILLKSLRNGEARTAARAGLRFGLTARALTVYGLTFVPRSILRWGWSFREWCLNRGA
jgi:glycosyltransferase involved in cell wall biosynthesis